MMERVSDSVTDSATAVDGEGKWYCDSVTAVDRDGKSCLHSGYLSENFQGGWDELEVEQLQPALA